jgi:hypothetical protein
MHLCTEHELARRATYTSHRPTSWNRPVTDDGGFSSPLGVLVAGDGPGVDGKLHVPPESSDSCAGVVVRLWAGAIAAPSCCSPVSKQATGVGQPSKKQVGSGSGAELHNWHGWATDKQGRCFQTHLRPQMAHFNPRPDTSWPYSYHFLTSTSGTPSAAITPIPLEYAAQASWYKIGRPL